MEPLKEVLNSFTSTEALNLCGFMLYGICILEICKVVIFPLIEEIANMIVRYINYRKGKKNDNTEKTNM